jgi:hypothetical protein
MIFASGNSGTQEEIKSASGWISPLGRTDREDWRPGRREERRREDPGGNGGAVGVGRTKKRPWRDGKEREGREVGTREKYVGDG